MKLGLSGVAGDCGRHNASAAFARCTSEPHGDGVGAIAQTLAKGTGHILAGAPESCGGDERAKHRERARRPSQLLEDHQRRTDTAGTGAVAQRRQPHGRGLAPEPVDRLRVVSQVQCGAGRPATLEKTAHRPAEQDERLVGAVERHCLNISNLAAILRVGTRPHDQAGGAATSVSPRGRARVMPC